MFTGLLDNTLKQIDIVEDLIQNHDAYAAGKASDQQRLIKEYAVASCVTRLYAVYERFVESLIADYLDAIPELVPYSSLSERLKTEYRMGISHVLGKLDREQYEHLSHENIVRLYFEALTSSVNYRFVIEALTHHDQNLRLNVVEHLVSRVDLKDLRTWLSRCPDILSLYEEHEAIFEQLDSEIKYFVQLRNDAAHGSLDTLQGKEILVRYCTLMRGLSRAMVAYVHKNLLAQLTLAGRMKRIGQVTEVFAKSGAFIARIDLGSAMKLGMAVHLVGASSCMVQDILSLEVDDVPVGSVTALQTDFEVGIKCSVVPKQYMEIYINA